MLEFQIGDVRDYAAVTRVLRDADIVFNARGAEAGADLRVFSRTRPCCTNILGAENIVRAIREHDCPIETVVGISTDKAASRSTSWA